MVLNPRGYNNVHEVEAEMERVRGLPELQFSDSPQGRFMEEIRRNQGRIPNAEIHHAPVPPLPGRAFNQNALKLPRLAPDLYKPGVKEMPPDDTVPSEMVRAEPENEIPGGTVNDAADKAKGLLGTVGNWPIVPIIIGGVIVLAFFALYRVVKKKDEE